MSSYKARALALQSEVDKLRARAKAKAKLQATIRELRAKLKALETAPCPRKPSQARTAAKGGAHWSDYLPSAWAACKASVGPEPWMVPNAAPWVELAPGSRSWVSERGVKVKWNPVCRLPAERYWPKGTFPKLNSVALEKPRPQLAKKDLAQLLTANRKRLPNADWRYAGGHSGLDQPDAYLRAA